MDELGAIYTGSEQQNTGTSSDDLADSTKRGRVQRTWKRDQQLAHGDRPSLLVVGLN
jgi:hypothetical protein